ncbi:hypothetical protein LJR104_003440 [Neorhizobium sp. LjRoot104]
MQSKKLTISTCVIPTIRGLNRQQAADYIGVSASLFDQMVKDGRMPNAKRVNGRTIWDRLALDAAFSRLPGGTMIDNNEWGTEV